MRGKTLWSTDNIKFQVEHDGKNDNMIKAQLSFTKRVYERILDKIASGRIDELAFGLFDDEQFERCFGISKGEYKIE